MCSPPSHCTLTGSGAPTGRSHSGGSSMTMRPAAAMAPRAALHVTPAWATFALKRAR
jgi:hypothetical protein